MHSTHFSAHSYGALIAFCLFAGQLIAQQEKIGFHLGAGIAGVQTPPIETVPGFLQTGRIPSIVFAAIWETTFERNRLGLEVAPGYTLKGFSQINPQLTTDEYRLNYLTIPIGLFYQPLRNDKIRITFGPETSYLFRSTINGEKTNNFFSSLYRKIDVGLFVGAQTKITTNLALGVRVHRAITPITDIEYTDDQGATLGTQKWYNYNGQLFARFYLNHNR